MTTSLTPFHHEALMYEGRDDFARRMVPFIREGVRAGEPVMVAVTADKIDLLRGELGPDAGDVRFADMAQIGRNPACIIPAWHAFVAESRRPGRPMRGIGEPIWSGRTSRELVECQLHESLINLAFEDAGGFRLLCPYDTTSLDASVIHEAHCSHPLVGDGDASADSSHYRGAPQPLSPSEAPLPRPPLDARTVAFGMRTLRDVRELVAEVAVEAGLGPARTRDVIVAVHEVATNSIRHGGGIGIVRVWQDDEGLVAQVKDRGTIRDPLAGRRTPAGPQVGGWGLWIANHTCDLVQMRTDAEGTIVRVLMRRG
jgi:anti-sigma regulatory factor (Ser/Thr protein kinase)